MNKTKTWGQNKNRWVQQTHTHTHSHAHPPTHPQDLGERRGKGGIDRHTFYQTRE